MRISFYKIFLLAVLTWSCETVVDMDLPDRDSRLSLNCLFGPDSVMSVVVSTSKSYVDPGSVTSIINAQVQLSGSDGTSLQLNHTNGNSDTIYFSLAEAYRFAVFAKEGVEYTLTAKAAGYPAASASASIPKAIPLTATDGGITNSGQKIIQSDGYDQGKVNVVFTDPGETENYYEIGFFNLAFIGQELDSQYYFFACESPAYAYRSQNDLFGGGNLDLFFNDELFNGREYGLTATYVLDGGYCIGNDFGIDTNDYSEYLIVELRHLSVEYYKFKKSYNSFLGAQGDPVAQPTNVFENIKNGHGIFAGYNSYRDTILVRKGTFPSPLDP